jgi:hypothetical protein
MAIITTILKNTKQQAIIKFVGDGSANVDLPNLAVSSDTIDIQANLVVPITQLAWSVTDSVSAPILIKRPATSASNVYILHGVDNWGLSQAYGISDSTNASSNINVTIPSNGGTLFMTLSKPAGFITQDLQANRK